jgi:hypothetical protein
VFIQGLHHNFDFSSRGKGGTGLPKFSEDLMYPDCALVGSSADMSYRGLGYRIHAHFPIIRVNRIPTSRFAADYGCRTDISLINNHETCTGRISLMDSPSATCSENVGNYTDARDSEFNCNPNIDCSLGGDGCPSMLLSANCETLRQNPIAAAGCLKDEIIDRVFQLPPDYRGTAPSSGLIAFFGFAPLCKHITLYGFSGSGSSDGHPVYWKHDYDAEHRLYARIASGNFTGMPLPFVHWATEALKDTYVTYL